jgi:hypothetical protein
MQRLLIQLSKPILEPGVPYRMGVSDSAVNAGPKVEFKFDGTRGVALVETSITSPWREDNFRVTLQLVIHKVDPQCNVLALSAK